MRLSIGIVLGPVLRAEDSRTAVRAKLVGLLTGHSTVQSAVHH